MVELPRMENGNQHSLCLSCAARWYLQAKYYCDESRLNGSGKRPIHCPKNQENKSSDAVVYALLKQQLRR